MRGFNFVLHFFKRHIGRGRERCISRQISCGEYQSLGALRPSHAHRMNPQGSRYSADCIKIFAPFLKQKRRLQWLIIKAIDHSIRSWVIEVMAKPRVQKLHGRYLQSFWIEFGKRLAYWLLRPKFGVTSGRHIDVNSQAWVRYEWYESFGNATFLLT